MTMPAIAPPDIPVPEVVFSGAEELVEVLAELVFDVFVAEGDELDVVEVVADEVAGSFETEAEAASLSVNISMARKSVLAFFAHTGHEIPPRLLHESS